MLTRYQAAFRAHAVCDLVSSSEHLCEEDTIIVLVGPLE